MLTDWNRMRIKNDCSKETKVSAKEKKKMELENCMEVKTIKKKSCASDNIGVYQ